jgi:radical SAM-linked protein
MAPDPTATQEPPAPARPPGAVDKVRLHFHKGGNLRWLSHHDLMRTFERMLRRADLPFRRSQGFHPHPRIVFALSLPLGVVGRAEVVEIELDQAIPPDEVRNRLRPQCPPGLDILDAQRIPTTTSAQVRGLCYALTIPADRAAAALPRVAELLAATQCIVERTRPTRRRLDIRPLIRAIRLDPATGRLEMDLVLTSAGAPRADEVLAQLGLADVLPDAVLERVRLDLEEDNSTPAGMA